MWPNPQFLVDMATFTEEILNWKLHFLCNVLTNLNKCYCHCLIDTHWNIHKSNFHTSSNIFFFYHDFHFCIHLDLNETSFFLDTIIFCKSMVYNKNIFLRRFSKCLVGVKTYLFLTKKTINFLLSGA